VVRLSGFGTQFGLRRLSGCADVRYGQGSRMSLASDDPEHVIVVPGRHFTPTASAGSAAAVSGDEVEGDLAPTAIVRMPIS
jgi:hypothetical protein